MKNPMTSGRLFRMALVAAAAAALIVAGARAQGAGPGPGPDGGRPGRGHRHGPGGGAEGCPGGPMMSLLAGRGPLARDLNLSDDQRDRIGRIFEDSRADMKPLFEKHAQDRDALEGLVHAASVDENAIRAAAGTLAASGADLAVARARTGEKVRAILTPAQIDVLDQARSRMEERRRTRRERVIHSSGSDCAPAGPGDAGDPGDDIDPV